MKGCFILATLALGAVASAQFFSSSTALPFRTEPGKTSRKYLIEAMVGGVGLLDFDGDGWLDIYLVNGADLKDPMTRGARPDKSDPRFFNRLFRNNHDGSFTDVTEKSGVRGDGYGMGVATGDFDNDGRTDLYVTQFGGNILYRNLGDGRFADVTAEARVRAGGWSTGSAFVDYDLDGDLDLFVARYLTWDFSSDIWCGTHEPGHRAYCHPDQFQPITHFLFRNDGKGRFEDVSAMAGLKALPGKGLGVAVNDFDRDGWPDILVANDSFPQQLLRNSGKGTFEDVALTAGIAYDDDGKTFAGMGVVFSDYDGDGWPDIFINALANQRYALFHNGKGIFEYVSGASGVGSLSKPHSGWGTGILDFDQDGWKDLFVAQGHVMDNIELTQPSVRYREPVLLMRNVAGRFSDAAASLGESAGTTLSARGAAFGDLNNDGATDIVINCLGEQPRLLFGKPRAGSNWLTVDTSIGASVRLVMASGREQHGYASTSSSYLSANDKRLAFGLGTDKTVKLVEVRRPDKTIRRLENVRANQILTVGE